MIRSSRQRPLVNKIIEDSHNGWTRKWGAAQKRLIVALVLIILPFQAPAAEYQAQVVGISDGDMITVLKSSKSHGSTPIELPQTFFG